jgi:hypothetical protein
MEPLQSLAERRVLLFRPAVNASDVASIAEPREYVARIGLRERDERNDTCEGRQANRPRSARPIVHEQSQDDGAQSGREHERYSGHNRRMVEMKSEVLGIRLIGCGPSTEGYSRTEYEQPE